MNRSILGIKYLIKTEVIQAYYKQIYEQNAVIETRVVDQLVVCHIFNKDQNY